MASDIRCERTGARLERRKWIPVSPSDLGVDFEWLRHWATVRTVGVGLRIGNGWTRYADFDPFVAGNVWFNARLLKSFGVLSQLRFKGQRPAFSNDDDKYRSFDPVRIRVQEWVTLWTVETGLSRSF